MLELTTVAKLNPLVPEIYPTKRQQFPLLLTEKNMVSLLKSLFRFPEGLSRYLLPHQRHL